MNAIAFATKRAFHSFLRITRRAFESIGLTAARFDLMHVLFNRAQRRGALRFAVLQSDVRRALGVSAGVVSRMLKGLDALGLTRRERARHDQRQVEVHLTAAGDETLRAARRMLLRGVQRMVVLAICFGRHRDPAIRLQSMDHLEGYLRAIASDFGDRATLYYPWGHPDD
jgi:DNA-binding MarR family transcriptional regulator